MPWRQGSGHMCTDLIFEMIPWDCVTAMGCVLCVGLRRETNSFPQSKLGIQK
jgi:hypothetical protein